MYFLAIDFITLLLPDGPAELEGSYATEYLSAGACFSANLQCSIFQFGNNFINRSQHLLFFFMSMLFSLFQLLHVRRTSLNSKLLGNKKIACISITHFYQFIGST